MLQQTQVKTVIPYWERWMQLPTVAAAAGAAAAESISFGKGLGYYTRVRNLQRAAQTIVREHGGVFPAKFEQVWICQGLDVTRRARSGIAFNQPTPADSRRQCGRVLTRVLGLPKVKSDERSALAIGEKRWSGQRTASRVATATVITTAKTAARFDVVPR